MVKQLRVLSGLAAIALLATAFPDLANATPTSGTAWDTPLQNIRNAFTGPIAMTIAVIGLVAAGGMLVFGGEMNEFARRMIILILVIALIMLAVQFLNGFFGVAGVEISPPQAAGISTGASVTGNLFLVAVYGAALIWGWRNVAQARRARHLTATLRG